MQTPPKLAEMMNKYDKEFQETFDYDEKKDGSMNNYITKRWGKRASNLVRELIAMK